MSAISVPGKVFLLGEYSVLDGGAALVAAVRPEHVYFWGRPDLESQLSAASLPKTPLHEWIADFSKDLDSKWIPRPWYGPSTGALGLGLGSSTAELAAAWSRQKIPAQADGLLTWYRQKFPKQSGVDLQVQLQAMGEGLGVYEVEASRSIRKLTLGASARSLLVLKAPVQKKLKTHEALQSYTRAPLDDYKIRYLHGRMIHLLGLDEINGDWKILNEWCDELAKHGLETEWARSIRMGLSTLRGVAGVKGCGAGLNDQFLVALESRYDREGLEAWIEKEGLDVLGTLDDLVAPRDRVTAFAPVNIAWIKYMGKREGRPTNASYSMTLDDLGTLTTLEQRSSRSVQSGHVSFLWNPAGYVPPESGREKMEAWMRDQRIWPALIESLGYSYRAPQNEVWILTQNSAPPATGIATSASSFAAMTLAWSLLQVDPSEHVRWLTQFEQPGAAGQLMREKLSEVASKGSGSAGRSLMGPWVVWNPKAAEGVSPFQKMELDSDWVDCVLLLETEPKKVSSSEAHQRVVQSPQFLERCQKLPTRIFEWMAAQESQSWKRVRQLILEEAIEMHQLFHTSNPPFQYWNEQTRRWIDWAQVGQDLPSDQFVVTLDAGANVHWLVRPRELKLWRTWFLYKDPQVRWIEGRSGPGGRYA